MHQSGEIHWIYAVGGANSFTMVVMFVGLLCWGRRAFPYYSYHRNPSGQEFFVSTGTLMAVKLLSIKILFRESNGSVGNYLDTCEYGHVSKITFWDGCDISDCVNAAVARPKMQRRARTMLIIKYGLWESKYWFLASKILVSKSVHQLSNLDGTITSSWNIISRIWFNRSYQAHKSSDEVIDKWIANSPNLQLLRLPTFLTPPKRTKKCLRATNFQTLPFLAATNGTKLLIDAPMGQTYCIQPPETA